MRFRSLRRFRTYGPQFMLDVLEDRIVLDASVAPAAQDQHDNAAHTTATDHAAQAQTGTTDAAAANAAGGHADASASHTDSATAAAAQVLNQDLKVVLVSNALDHVDTIAQAAKDNAKVIVMDPLTDNLSTVDAKLESLVQATGQKISTIAVVAHGTSGGVEIGADSININNFFKYESGFKTLSNVLAEGAQIQFYGCSVAAGSAGEGLLGKIADDTHATVFASLDNTGGQDNNWNLEYSTNPATPMYVLLDQAKLGNVNDVLSFTGVWPLSDPTQYNTYWGTVDVNDPVGIDGRHAEFWTFYGTAGEIVSLGMQTTRPEVGYGNSPNIDTFLEVFNPDGTQAAQIDDWKSPPGTGNDPPYSLYSDSLLQWQLPQTGWYVVQACTWNLGDYGDYSLIGAREDASHVIHPLDMSALSGNNIQNKVDYRTVPDVSVDNNFTNYTYDMADFFGKPPNTTPTPTYSITGVTDYLGAGTYTDVIDPATGLITFTHTGTGSGYLDVTVQLTDGSSTASDTFRLNVTPGNAAPYVENGGLPNVNVWPGDPLTKIIDLSTYFHDWEDGNNLTYTNPPTIVDTNGVIASWTLDNTSKLLTLNYSAAGQGTATITVTGTDTGGRSFAEIFDVTARLNEPLLQNLGFDTGNTNGWTVQATPVSVITTATAGGGFDKDVVKVDIDGGDANPAQLSQGFQWQGEQIQVGYDFFTHDAIGYDHFAYTISLNGKPIAYVNRDAGWSGYTVHQNNTTATTGWIYEPVLNPADFGAHIGDVIDITLTAGNDVTSGNYDSWAYFDLQAVTNANPVSKGIANIEVMEDSSDTVLNLHDAFYDAQTPAAQMTYKYTITSTGTDNTNLFDHLDGITPVLNAPVTITNPSAFALDYGLNQSGYANIKITATDADNHSIDYTFNVTVRPVNDRPTGTTDQTVTVETGQSVDITLTGNDPELFAASAVKFATNYAGTGSLTKVTGTFQDLGGGNYSEVWRYTPNANYYGSETFQYSASTPTGTWNAFGTTPGVGTAVTTKLNTSNDGTYDMQLVDLNHDGYLDLVEANQQSNGTARHNYFFLNDKAGGFGAATQLGSDTSSSLRIMVGDINGDKDPANGNPWLDVVVANTGASDYVYTWTSGSNTFSGGTALTRPSGTGTSAIALGDFDGDGHQDIVIATNESPGKLYIYKNSGTGTFGTGTLLQTYGTGAIGAIGVGDFNGDGYVDIVVGKDGTSDDLVYINNGSGSFTQVIHLPTAGRANTTYLAVGDVDSDGHVDVVMGGTGINRFYKNNGSGSFTFYQIGTETDDTACIRLADMNKDGYLDVVAFNERSGGNQTDKVYLYNTGTTNPYQAASNTVEGTAIRDQCGALGDIDNDGDIDLIMGILTNSNQPAGVTQLSDRLFLNQGFADSTVAQSPHAGTDSVHTELLHNWGFETGNLGTDAWHIDERTTEDDPTLLALVGVVSNNFTIDVTTNESPTDHDVKDLYDNGYPPQMWAQIGAGLGAETPDDPYYQMYSHITVNDNGGSGDHILVSTDSGPRKDMIYQDVVIPNDPSVTKYEITWRMCYWDLDYGPRTQTHDPHFYGPSATQPQYVALYVYDPTQTRPAPVWITTEGVDPYIVVDPVTHQPALQDYKGKAIITDPALRGTTVRIALEVFSGDNFLQVAVDDFHIEPTRSASPVPNPGTVHTGLPPYNGEGVLTPNSGMSAMASATSLLLDPVGVTTTFTSSSVDTTDPSLLLTKLSSTTSSDTTLVQTLETLSSSPSLVTVLEQQVVQTATTASTDLGTTSSSEPQTTSTTTTATVDTTVPTDVQPAAVSPDTTTTTTDTPVVPDTTAPVDTTVPVPDPAPTTPVDTVPILAGVFSPDLNLMTTMVFDWDDVSAMQVLAAGTTMDSFPQDVAELQQLAAKLGGSESVSLGLQAVKFTEIFA